MRDLAIGLSAIMGIIGHLILFAIFIGVMVLLIWRAVESPGTVEIVLAALSPLIASIAAGTFMLVWDLAMVPIVLVLNAVSTRPAEDRARDESRWP